jgi:hypothetical protein
MAEQEHELWLDRTKHYSLGKFHHEMSTKMVWGPSQTLAPWVVELENASKWKIRRDEHFQQLILDRWNEKVALLAVDVISKFDAGSAGPSNAHSASDVTSAHVTPVNDEGSGPGPST